MLWLLGVALSWPIIAAREMDFNSAAPAEGLGPVVLTALIVLTAGVWLDAIMSRDRAWIERWVARPLVASVVIAAAVVFYQAFVDISWLSSEVWIASRRAPGLMGDANPMAVAAALWAPLAVFAMPRGWRVAGTVLAPLLWSAAWLTGARTVVVLVAAGVVGLAGGIVAERAAARRAVFVAAIAALAIGLAAVALTRESGGGPLARLVSTLPLDRPAALTYEVLWRRDGYGLAAARAIREHPWSGVGNGAFYTVSSYFHRLDGGATIPSDNAQNLWRHALAERGVLAFAAVVALTVATVRLLARRAQHVSMAQAWTLKAMVVGMGVVLVFGYPIQNAAIALTAAALLAWLHASVAPSDAPVRGGRLHPAIVAAIWLLAIAGAAIDLVQARGDLRPAWRAARVGDLYLYGFGDVEAGQRAASGRVVTDYAVVSLRPTGPRYLLRCWVRGDAARHVSVWQNRRLVIDELLPPSVIMERSLETPLQDGVLLEFDTDPPGLVITGDFVR
jgi:O-antigen ligase